MKITCVPVLDDNFAYLLTDEAGVTAAVDPAEADKVTRLNYVNQACFMFHLKWCHPTHTRIIRQVLSSPAYSFLVSGSAGCLHADFIWHTAVPDVAVFFV